MSNEAFDIWLKENYLHTNPPLIEIWQAAKANSEQEIAELKETINELRWMQGINTDYATAELQSNINDLRESLEFYSSKMKYSSSWSNNDSRHVMEDKGSTAKQALSKTPAQSMTEHDNEVIEKCAKVCDGYTHGAWFADKIRALKGK